MALHPATDADDALLWLMPVDVRIGRRVQRHRLHLQPTGSLGWAGG